jgi:host factor-I protein
MPQIRESKPSSAQPNIQDVFLNYARREKLAVLVRLMDGTEFEGRVKNFDRFAVII